MRITLEFDLNIHRDRIARCAFVRLAEGAFAAQDDRPIERLPHVLRAAVEVVRRVQCHARCFDRHHLSAVRCDLRAQSRQKLARPRIGTHEHVLARVHRVGGVHGCLGDVRDLRILAHRNVLAVTLDQGLVHPLDHLPRVDRRVVGVHKRDLGRQVPPERVAADGLQIALEAVLLHHLNRPTQLLRLAGRHRDDRRRVRLIARQRLDLVPPAQQAQVVLRPLPDKPGGLATEVIDRVRVVLGEAPHEKAGVPRRSAPPERVTLEDVHLLPAFGKLVRRRQARDARADDHSVTAHRFKGLLRSTPMTHAHS